MSLKMSPQFLKFSFYRQASGIVTAVAVLTSTTIYIVEGNLQIAPLKEHFNEKPSLNPELKFMEFFGMDVCLPQPLENVSTLRGCF